jgi:hypothetical protein
VVRTVVAVEKFIVIAAAVKIRAGKDVVDYQPVRNIREPVRVPSIYGKVKKHLLNLDLEKHPLNLEHKVNVLSDLFLKKNLIYRLNVLTGLWTRLEIWLIGLHVKLEPVENNILGIILTKIERTMPLKFSRESMSIARDTSKEL